MLPGCDLGDNAAVNGVQRNLGRDNIGHNFPSVSDNCCSGLIAGAFNGEDCHIPAFISLISILFVSVLLVFDGHEDNAVIFYILIDFHIFTVIIL